MKFVRPSLLDMNFSTYQEISIPTMERMNSKILSNIREFCFVLITITRIRIWIIFFVERMYYYKLKLPLHRSKCF